MVAIVIVVFAWAPAAITSEDEPKVQLELPAGVEGRPLQLRVTVPAKLLSDVTVTPSGGLVDCPGFRLTPDGETFKEKSGLVVPEAALICARKAVRSAATVGSLHSAGCRQSGGRSGNSRQVGNARRIHGDRAAEGIRIFEVLVVVAAQVRGVDQRGAATIDFGDERIGVATQAGLESIGSGEIQRERGASHIKIGRRLLIDGDCLAEVGVTAADMKRTPARFPWG